MGQETAGRVLVNDRIRYQAQTVYLRQDGVTAYRGVDPVTGLPVLIYRFAGVPHTGLARLDSDLLPRVLAWREEGEEGIVVVAFSSAYVAAEPGSGLTHQQLLDSAEALSHAAAAGVSHGDLTRERFLLAGDTVVLEGFGLPWKAGAAGAGSADDVRAWALAVQELGHPEVPGVRELVARAASARADQRPSPAALHAELDRLLFPPAAESSARLTPVVASEPEGHATVDRQEDPGAAAEAGGAPRDEAAEAAAGEERVDAAGVLEWDDFAATGGLDRDTFRHKSPQLAAVEEIVLDFSPGDVAQPATEPDEPDDDMEFRPSRTFASERFAGAQPPARPAGHADAATAADAPRAGSGTRDAARAGDVQEDPESRVKHVKASSGSSSFIKSLPPGGQYRSTEPARSARGGGSRTTKPATPEREGDRRSRRIFMLVALVILSSMLAVLAFYWREGSAVRNQPVPQTQAVTYVIDVLVDPPDLPPVTLYVLESPAGSQLRPNTILGTAPRRIALDAEGTWIFEGRFQGRVSESVTLSIPEDRLSTITIVIPPPPEAEEP